VAPAPVRTVVPQPAAAASGVPAAVPSASAPAAPTVGAAPRPVTVVAPVAAAAPAGDTASAASVRAAEADKAAPKPADESRLLDTEMAPDAAGITDTPAASQDLWARVRGGFAMPVLDTEAVRRWEQFYLRQPDYLQRMFERGSRYLFHIVEETTKRGLPSELALLPFIESAFNPLAQSPAKASGIWQFMPATGRDFDLRQNLFRDDRRSVLDSTRAALDYLSRLQSQFGDWHLALAAYNWGQGNVARAQERNRRRGAGTSYLELPMPDETRNYVPKLQAIINLVARPEAFGVQLPPVQNHPYFLTVSVDRDIDVALAARLAGISGEDFQALNPQLNKPVILAAATPKILLPYDNARRYRAAVDEHRGPFASWTAWVAPRTLRPAEAARLVGMPEAQLREINRIPPRMMLRAGSTLLVPRGHAVQRDVSEHVADTAALSLVQEPAAARKRVVKVGPRGESVAALARRYRVSAQQLAGWNDVAATGSFKAGQSVVLYTAAPRASAKPAAARTAARTAAKPAARATAPAARQTKPAPRQR
jgi:membrane-bound lytic murein transglycosylase D